eukprot:evm.model.scf_169EXC.1 EVM.evm.TU.scf_169EXC.1   scf_169EXC:15701-20836(+)
MVDPAEAGLPCATLDAAACDSHIDRTCTLYTKYTDEGDIAYGDVSEGQLLDALIDANEVEAVVDEKERAYRDLRDSVSRHWWQTTFGFRHRSVAKVPLFLYILYVIVFVSVTVGAYPHIFVDCRGQKCLLYNLSVPVQLVTGAMFFLLTFRTDLCYNRWWEGCMQWKLMVTSSTNLVFCAILSMGNSNLTKAIVRWSIAYPIIVKAHIRKETDKMLREQLENQDKSKTDKGAAVLVETEILNVLKSRHRPNYVLTQITSIIQQAVDVKSMSLMWMGQLTDCVAALQLHFEALNRIVDSPLPFAYTSHSRTFMMIWLSAVPLSIVHDLEWLTIPISIVIGYCILGIEGIAEEIENPFGGDISDLDVNGIVQSCKAGMLQCVETIDGINADVEHWGKLLKAKARNEVLSKGPVSYTAKASEGAMLRKRMLDGDDRSRLAPAT